MNRVYLCIDLKTFYASVECVERHLDPFKTNLVVADTKRGKGSICLAITPRMKELGIHNRCRLYEIPKSIDYIAAIPRMKLYIHYSADVYSIYLKYVSKDDILVYSIDECFIDVTSYLKMYQLSAEELAKKMIDDVYNSLGLCATVGIGTNLFLAKVALDISAKHKESHMDYLDITTFKKEIWFHRPITDIWNIGPGIAKRLAKYGAYDLHAVSLLNEDLLYKEFGVNALFLIDHANGIEPCTIKEVHDYHSKNNSLSNGQVLFEDYSYEDALLVVKEMIDLNVSDLIDKGLVTDSVSLNIGYSKDQISPTGGSFNIGKFTNSKKTIKDAFLNLYNKTTNKNSPIRRINIGFGNVISEEFKTIDLFSNEVDENKEIAVEKAIIQIKKKYGKNSVFKAMDLKEKATIRKRNLLIGGHNGE